MATKTFHFIDDYRNLVQRLLAQYPLHEAMSRAVGGNYEAIGEIEKQLLIGYGLSPDSVLVDIGCGSGRLEKALIPFMVDGQVLGTDVVQELVDYAQIGCPPDWHFAVVEDIRIPLQDDCADFACFFSVFTHLLHEESYCYLLEAQRVVKPGGRIVFSFLEYAHNWPIFEGTYRTILCGSTPPHLNTFIGRDAIQAWSEHMGMRILEFRAANDPFIQLSRPVTFDNGVCTEHAAALGQSVCVFLNVK